jgi:hypothetical protein
MPEIGTSGSMSGDGKRSDAEWPQATAPILDSTETRRPDQSAASGRIFNLSPNGAVNEI